MLTPTKQMTMMSSIPAEDYFTMYKFSLKEFDWDKGKNTLTIESHKFSCVEWEDIVERQELFCVESHVTGQKGIFRKSHTIDDPNNPINWSEIICKPDPYMAILPTIRIIPAL
jgi:hypothetical protein